MNYVVTHKLPEDIGPSDQGIPTSHAPEHVISRSPVATLDEVDQKVADLMRRHAGYVTGASFVNWPEGGTVGPLPDGTVITVTREP